MKKKLILFAAILALALSFCACGGTEDDGYTNNTTLREELAAAAEAVGGYTYESAVTLAEYYAAQDGYEIIAEAYSDLASIVAEAGSFVELSDYSVTISGKTVTATQVFTCENRDVKLIYVINSTSGDITSINFEIVYSTAETMQKAALNTVMGISVVFCVLVLISLVIYCFRLIPMVTAFFEAKKGTPESVKAVTPEAIAAASPVASATDDLALIAVITAAIAASTGATTDSFVVRSIKRR